MKKAFRFFTVFFTVALISTLSSCALIDRIIEEFVGPEKKWQAYENYQFEYGTPDEKGNKKSIYLDVYLMYSDTPYSNVNMKNLYDEESKPKTSLPAGLSVLVVPSLSKNTNDIIKEVFGALEADGTPFILMTLDKGDDAAIQTSEDGENQTNIKSFIVNKTTWGILYNCVDFTGYSASKLPTPLVKAGDYQSVSEAAGNFSLKKLLGRLAISKIEKLIESK